jgi:hypothetical protein
MLKSPGTRLDALQAIIARRDEELAFFLALSRPGIPKFQRSHGFRSKEKESTGPEALEAGFTLDDFFRNFINHGLGVVFPYQTG